MESWMGGVATEQRLQWLRQYNDFSQPAEGRLFRYGLRQRAQCLALRDAQGQWCGLQRMRRALERGEELTPRETIQYNGGPYTIEEYRAYMAKNLFRFAIPQELTHGGDGVRVMLEPLGYHSELVPEYPRTHSEEAFWENPLGSLFGG